MRKKLFKKVSGFILLGLVFSCEYTLNTRAVVSREECETIREKIVECQEEYNYECECTCFYRD